MELFIPLQKIIAMLYQLGYLSLRIYELSVAQVVPADHVAR